MVLIKSMWKKSISTIFLLTAIIFNFNNLVSFTCKVNRRESNRFIPWSSYLLSRSQLFTRQSSSRNSLASLNFYLFFSWDFLCCLIVSSEQRLSSVHINFCCGPWGFWIFPFLQWMALSILWICTELLTKMASDACTLVQAILIVGFIHTAHLQ